MRQYRGYGSRDAGFTLVELVVVLVILGLVAAVALPKFFDLEAFRERGAYDELAGAVRYAQKLAVASGCEVQVSVTASGYALQQHVTDCNGGAFTTISNHPISAGTFSGVSLSSSPASFVFDALGRSSSAATLSVGGRSFSVVAETGYVDAP